MSVNSELSFWTIFVPFTTCKSPVISVFQACASHIGEVNRRVFLPLLDNIDLKMGTEEDEDRIQWANLKADMVHNIKAQFQVLEVSCIHAS
jgi:hypothetical protein